MYLSPSISAFLTVLEGHAGRTFIHRDLVGDLLQIACARDRDADLDRLSFLGKFLVRSFGIMQRIGKDAEGYDGLSKEFTVQLAEARSLLTTLLQDSPENEKQRHDIKYLAMTPAGLDNFLGLLRDLSWYKNWRIDNPGALPWETP